MGCGNHHNRDNQENDSSKNINLEILNGDIVDGLQLIDPKLTYQKDKYVLEFMVYNTNETDYESKLINVNLFDINSNIIIAYDYKDCIIDNVKSGEYAKLTYNIDTADDLSKVRKISIYSSDEWTI